MNALITASRPALQRSLLHQTIRSSAMRSMTVLSKQSAEEYKKLNYSARMKELGRPVSPHVTVYAFPIGALSSIINRVTGVVLSLGCAGLGFADLVAGSGSSLYLLQMIGGYGGIVAAGAKFTVAFPIVYHYGGAIRHLLWDEKTDLLTNVDVEKSSYILLGGATAISGALMFV